MKTFVREARRRFLIILRWLAPVLLVSFGTKHLVEGVQMEYGLIISLMEIGLFFLLSAAAAISLRENVRDELREIVRDRLKEDA